MLAYSLYLWHWPLLIFWLSYSDRTHAGAIDGAVVLLVSRRAGVPDHPVRREPAASPPAGGSPDANRMPLRARFSPPDDRAADPSSTLLAVALTATSFTWHEHVTVQRASGRDSARVAVRCDYPGAVALTSHIEGAEGDRRGPPCSRRRGTCLKPPRWLYQRLRRSSLSASVPTATRPPPASSRWPAARTPNTGSPRSMCWGNSTTSRSSPI